MDNGALSLPVSVPVLAEEPGLFATGAGQAAALNLDGTVNSAANPVSRASWIMLFGTGAGQMPGAVDGELGVKPLPKPAANVTVTIGGEAAEVHYAGAAPGLVSGVVQVNAEVPADIQPGDAVPVVMSVAGVAAKTVTIAVK